MRRKNPPYRLIERVSKSESSSVSVKKDVPIFKTAEERLVIGIVLEPLKELGRVDAQNDLYSAEEVRKAAESYMENYGQIGLQHEEMLSKSKARVVYNWITHEDTTMYGRFVAKGTWILGVRILDDQIWGDIKTNKITGFSIGGFASREPVSREMDSNYAW